MKADRLDGVAVPRRMTPPRWFDIRIIGGVLLVIGSVVVGAKVIGSSSHTSPVWSASKDLAIGTVLTAGDLVPVDVNLGDDAPQYLAAADPAKVIGAGLVVPVRAGELVPAAAVRPTDPGRVVVIGVTPDRMPPGVGHGSLVDLYLITGGATAAAEARTELISAKVTVQSVAAPASGGLSGATSNRYQVAVLVPPQAADVLIKTLPKGEAVLALWSGAR